MTFEVVWCANNSCYNGAFIIGDVHNHVTERNKWY